MNKQQIIEIEPSMLNNQRYQNPEYYNNPECYQNRIQKMEIQEQVQPIVPQNLDYDQNEWIDQFSQNTSKSLIYQLNHDKQQKQSKYHDYVKKIQYFFLETNNENQLILTLGWIPIIPQSNDSTVEETILNTNTFVKVQLVDEYLSDFDKHLNELQDNNQQQKNKITEMREQAIKYQKKMKEYTEKENQSQTEYNKLSDEYTYLESNYLIYLQKIEKDDLLKDNSKILRGSTKYTLQLMEDRNQMKEQNQNLSESISQKKQQIQEKIENLQGIQNEKFKLKEQLTQLQKQYQFQSQTLQQGENISEPQQYQTKSKSKLDSESPYMTLTLAIDAEEHTIQKPKSTKYNDFIQEITEKFFPKLEKRNQSSLVRKLESIIPESSESLILKAQLSTIFPQIKQNLKEFRKQLVMFLDDFQQINRKQQGELSEVQDQITKCQESTKTLKEKIKEKEIEYNKLKQNLQLLESIYKLILEITGNRQFMKNDCDLIKQMNQNTLNLVNEKDELENLNQKLQQEQSQLNQQFEEQRQKIENLWNETFSLKKQIGELQEQQQYQIQEKDYQNFKQMKTTGIRIKKNNSDNVDSKQPLPQQVSHNLEQKQDTPIISQQIEDNFEQKQELPQLQKTKTNIDMAKLNSTQQSQYELRQSNQNTQELKTQLSKCSYCNLSCSKFILLPCLHSFHEDCLEILGKKAVEAEKPDVKCICSKKIPIKLFTKNIQYWLLANQVDQIFQQYKESYQLRQCNNCDFFYFFNKFYNWKQSYCPNCQI